MRIPSRKYTVTAATSGNFDQVAAGGSAAGATLQSQNIMPGTLCAVYLVDAETSSLTMAAQWQGSDDNSTWVDVAAAANNPANVVLATGTGGADASVTKAIPAPPGIYGFRYVRASAVTAGATGATTDTYAISYRYLAQ